MKRKKACLLSVCFVLLFVCGSFAYQYWFAPTRILIVNPLPAQAADIALNNDSKYIEVTCIKTDAVKDLSGYDAIMMYGRGLFLDEEQMKEVVRVASKGVPVFTNVLRQYHQLVNQNVTDEQIKLLQLYFQNACKPNYRNVLRYIRHLATPHRMGDQEYDPPVELPNNLFYHQEYGQYFETPDELTSYLKQKGIYHERGKNVGFSSGVNFPVEGNRAHVDSLISRLTQAGFNVYPMTGTGKGREEMIRKLHPDAIVYLPMGRLGNDSLIQWLNKENIPLFMPFPLVQPREEWLDADKPVGGGTLTARVVVPEIDGGMAPYCISTQNESPDGYMLYTPEPERIDAFIDHFTRYLGLRDMSNQDKRIAICYFKNPGKDALIASGMEVIPSLYNFLKRLRAEGYNVSGLPANVEAFGREIHQHGAVLGSYAPGAQAQFLKTARPVWLSKTQYEEWARQILLPEKYAEVVSRYGEAPGELLANSDSLAVACLQYGNVLLFPQPRPALGEDDFKLVHGAKVAPPHSYLAPYFYMQKGFKADVLIHFGTHGNLEFTPGKNVGQSQADWSDVLVGSLPHFYFYTTGNVGESVIAKRRTHAVLLSYLTPPYVESGMRQQYGSLLNDIHKVLDEGAERHPALGQRIKQEVIRLGLHRDLDLDSLSPRPYTESELQKLDVFTEEIANEKITGAYYTMGEPYSEQDLLTTTLAISADPLAYETALKDRNKGIITTEQLQDFSFISHHYLPDAKKRLTALLHSPTPDMASVDPELRSAMTYRNLLAHSPKAEMDAMICALNGGVVSPAPGGDPVLNPNVLPTGRNMYSINAEATPNIRAWEDGKRLAETTLKKYVDNHGTYPRKVSYTFWAGEFINTEGATLAQVFWMLGVEPVRDKQGRVMDLKLISSQELGRPRINVLVQVSGQLRDIAGSRLKLLTDAVRLAAESSEDIYPNYVASGTLQQEKHLLEKGSSPKRARQLALMRVFGPINNGYSTGMLNYTEHSGSWENEEEVANGFLNNMGAVYGDEENWGVVQDGLLAAALTETDVIIQPRQSNTWGPLSLDHVYEFTGGLSLAVKTVTGKVPDAYMADYRNRNNHRLQDAREAIAIETRATILNPTFITKRMQGGEGTAQMFGEIFRNIFGWHVMRPSVMNKELYNELYRLYILDEKQLGIHEYFQRVNPAAYQSITSVMLESARKGYWQASEEQLQTTATLHAQMTCNKGAACTEFVCGNQPLQRYIADKLSSESKEAYQQAMQAVHKITDKNGKEVVLKQQSEEKMEKTAPESLRNVLFILGGISLTIGLMYWIKRRGKE